jgi:hypothetical protein
MDAIKTSAKGFYRNSTRYTKSLETYNRELSSRLSHIYKENEKLRFLSYLRDLIESNYREHVKTCKEGKSCGQHEPFENSIYSVNQQYDYYNAIVGDFDVSEKPAMKFFEEGHYFDAFSAIRELIKKAERSIVLIDGFVDCDTLAFFPGKEPEIELTLITKSKSNNDLFQKAIHSYNKQYENLKVKVSEKYHDRFLIIDDKKFYHIGASIKDAGNKIFMYTKIEDPDIMNLIRKKIDSD